MGERQTSSNLSDSIDEFFDPMLGEGLEDNLDEKELPGSGKQRLAELRRRAELRLEEKRMREQFDYLELDWDDL